MDRWLQQFADAVFRRSFDIAHDLKTPLNIAVLNLELMKMRAAKLGAGRDPKMEEHASAVEAELRRMARIFDAVFLYAVPPRERTRPERLDLFEIARDVAGRLRYPLQTEGRGEVRMHEERARHLILMMLEGAGKIFPAGPAVVGGTLEAGSVKLTLRGPGDAEALGLGKLFKFYYTDAAGTPETSFATARLIAECYGGTMEAKQEGADVVIELSLPLGES